MVTSTCSLHVSLDDQSESSTSSRYPIPIHLGGSCSDHELLVAGPMESTPHWAPSQSHSTTGPPPPSVPSSSSSEPDNLPAVVAMAGSSANSILSASGTLVSESVRRRSSSSTTVQPHDISRSSTTQTLATAVHSAALDPQHIKAMMNDLNKHLERFEELNNQVLEAMTSYDRHNLGLDTDQGRLLSTPSAESLPPRSVGFETSSQDLERQRQATALSAAELIQALWPRLRPGSTSTDIHTPHMYQQTSSKAAKQRVKIATQLKNAITTLWSSQSLFQERAQLVLDIFQDPTELEREDGIRTLRSRHLNSLLSTTLSPTECDQLAQKFKDDQEKMALILDRLQGDWLGIMLILDNPDQGHSQSGKAANEGAQSDGDDTRESFGRRLLRISKDKREALKSIIKNW